MAELHATVEHEVLEAGPAIRTIRKTDLLDVLRKGVADFNEKPSHVIFLALIYPLVAFALFRLSFGYELLPLLFPLAAGFALIGPVAAIGLYEISRRLELGEEAHWNHALGVLESPSRGAIVRVALILVAIFTLWIVTAAGIYLAIFGNVVPTSPGHFAQLVLDTPQGWWLVIVGNAVGALFALVVLSISVVSVPLLLDRNVRASFAMTTSIRAVLANPGPMLLWGIIVAGGLLLGSLPFFVGLCVVLPVLGHASWHLYRKVVAW